MMWAWIWIQPITRKVTVVTTTSDRRKAAEYAEQIGTATSDLLVAIHSN